MYILYLILRPKIKGEKNSKKRKWDDIIVSRIKLKCLELNCVEMRPMYLLETAVKQNYTEYETSKSSMSDNEMKA